MFELLSKRYFVLKSILVFCLLCTLGYAQAALAAEDTPDERFSEVRRAFDQGSFKEARYLAETLNKDMRKQGKVSSSLFELIGHIRYREGDLGGAALWYERASLFPPPVPEVRQNLAHIHTRTGSLVFAPNDVPSQLAAWLTRSQWLQIAIVCGWIIVLEIAFCLLFVRSSSLRAFVIVTAVLAFIAGGLSLLGWHFRPSYEQIKDIEVVTAKDSHAYTGASTTSGSVTELPPGSQVRQLETRGAWTYVEIPADNGSNRGWIQTDRIAPLWPEDFGARYID